MNKLKALLIAGLLSLTSVSFATSLTTIYNGDGSVQYTAEGARGVIELLNDGNSAQLTGDFTVGNGLDEFYEINNVGHDTDYFMSFGQSTDSAAVDTVTISLLEGATYALAAANVVGSNDGTLNYVFDITKKYYLLLSGSGTFAYSVDVSAVPVPAAGILFASALLGAGAFGRRKKKAKASVVGAFARAS